MTETYFNLTLAASYIDAEDMKNIIVRVLKYGEKKKIKKQR